MVREPELIALPGRLLRFYKSADRRYAEAFAFDGRLRLWELAYFRRIEDASRADPDEGEGRLRVPGQVPLVNVSVADGRFTDGGTVQGHFNFGTTWVQPLYVFCTSLPDVSVTIAGGHLGSELVIIHDPARFAAELTRSAYLLHLGEREILWVEAFPVRYDKDAVSDLPSDQSARHRLPYGQKASRFEVEREYRFVVAVSGVRQGALEFLDLQLGHPERFCDHCASGSAV